MEPHENAQDLYIHDCSLIKMDMNCDLRPKELD
jgi:hypothetical protein